MGLIGGLKVLYGHFLKQTDRSRRTVAPTFSGWPGTAASARILLTAGARLIALDAATGQPAQGFGTNGFIDISMPWNGVPTIYKHVAILGATTARPRWASPATRARSTSARARSCGTSIPQTGCVETAAAYARPTVDPAGMWAQRFVRACPVHAFELFESARTI